MPARNQILVFAKLPRAGRVKTRLVGPLSAREAAALHQACLQDTLRMVEAFGAAERRLLPRDFDLDRPTDLRRAERLLRARPKLCPALREWFAARRRARTALR